MHNRKKCYLGLWSSVRYGTQPYLDTHPDDMRALQEFRMRSQELIGAKMEYERVYGPLLNFGLGMTGRTRQWIQDPWPWEVNWRRS